MALKIGKFNLGRTIERLAKTTHSTLGQTINDPVRASLFAVTGGASLGSELATEYVGKIGSELDKAISGEPAAATSPSVLDLKTDSTEAVEEQNKKKLMEMARINAPGVRSQTILNLR